MDRADVAPLTVTVDRTFGLPAAEQIRLQVLAHLATNRLAPGDLVPGAHDLAARAEVEPYAAERAYEALSRAGVLEPGPEDRFRVGSVPEALATNELRTAAVRLMTWARAEDLDDDAILDLVRRALLGVVTPPPTRPHVPGPRAPFEDRVTPVEDRVTPVE